MLHLKLLVLCAVCLYGSCDIVNNTGLSKDIIDLIKLPPDAEGYSSENVTITTEIPHVSTEITISEDIPFGYNTTDTLEETEEFYNDKVNQTVPWNMFIALLMQESFEQLKNIQYNIKNNYQLGDYEINDVDNVFNKSEQDFENLLMRKHKTMTKEIKTNSPQEFMIEFMKASNTFLEKIVAYNLGLIKGKLDSSTKWFHQSLRDKILRQQAKNSSNYIQFRICKVLSVCNEKTSYSDYVVEWIRHLLALDAKTLKEFFVAVPKVLKIHENFVKSNVKFRQTLKYIINSHVIVQRDTLDFLDEVITKRTKTYRLVPEALKSGAKAFTHLFTLLDKYYVLDTENRGVLEDISDILSIWKYQDINVSYVLKSIVDNMKINVESWSKDVAVKLESIWYTITVL